MYLDVIANYNKCPFSLFVCLQMADMNYLSFTEIELRAKDASVTLQDKTNEAQPLLHQPETSYSTQP